MAIRDWPTDREYLPAQMSLGLDVSELMHVGFRTGNRTRQSNLVDRLTCALTLPACRADVAAARQAYILSLRSTSDWVRFGLFSHRANTGTITGQPLVATAAAAGARSVVLKRVRQAKNLLTHVMAFDQDVWVNTATVTVNTTANPVNAVVNADTINDTSNTVTQRVTQAVSIPADTATYTFSIYVLKTTGGTAPTFSPALQFTGGASSITLQPRVNTDTGAVLSGTATVTSVGSWWRVSVTGANDGTHTTCTVFAFPAFGVYGSGAQDVTVTGAKVVWGAQLELGAAATSVVTGALINRGDLLSIGGNLCMVADTTSSNSTGNITVLLATPLLAAAAVDATVELAAPTGVWELDSDTFDIQYTPGRVQGPLVLAFRQVPQ